MRGQRTEVTGREELGEVSHERPPEEDRTDQNHADRRIAQDADDEEVAGLAGGRGDRDGHGDADQPADALLDALPAYQPDDEEEDGGTERRPDADPEPREAVGDDEGDRRQRRVDHAAPAAELF